MKHLHLHEMTNLIDNDSKSTPVDCKIFSLIIEIK